MNSLRFTPIKALSVAAITLGLTLSGCGKSDNQNASGDGTTSSGTYSDTSEPSAISEYMADASAGDEATDHVTESMTYPPGATEGTAMTITRTTPKKVTAGKAFTYQIVLTNPLTDAMKGVKVRETVPANFVVQKTDPATSGTAPTEATQPQTLQWTVDVPAAGASTISVTGVPSQGGGLDRTLSVSTSNASELQSHVDVAQPTLVLTREAPARAELGDPIEYKYVVTNNGDGDTGTFQITEALPAGLTTNQNAASVTFELGSLAKGARKEFVVALKPAKPGTFTGHSTAKGAFGEVASPETTTIVVAPKLAVDIKGDTWEAVNQPVTYAVTIRNDGDAPARDVSLGFQPAGVQGAQLVTGADMDTPAAPNAAAPQQVGTIEPNTSKVVNFTLRVPTKGTLTVSAAVTSKPKDAPAAPANTAAQPESATPAQVPEQYRATAQAQTTIIGVSATTLEVSDQADPVTPGGEINYTIVAQNYGSANDRDVAVVVTLPEGVTIAANGVQGPTQPKAEGQKLTFPPMATLAPNQPQQWTIKVTAPAQPGEKRCRVELRSASVVAPIIRTETTRIAVAAP